MAEPGFLPAYVCVKKRSGPMCSKFVDRQGSIREIGHHNFFTRSVEYRAAQLPAVAGIAGVTGRARIDYQDSAEALHHLMVCVAVEDEISGGFGEPL